MFMKRFNILTVAGLCLLVSCGGGKVKRMTAEIVAEYPHDTLSYTQGLFFNAGRLYESTGLNGLSTLREVDLATGQALKKVEFEKDIFAEGCVPVDDEIYVMTWQNGVIFKYGLDSLDFRWRGEYPREGWGITTDGTYLYASDGSAHIYVMDKDLHLVRKMTVKNDGKIVRWLNELEWIDGKIWANVYCTNAIVVIDPKSGSVNQIIDCSGIYPQKNRRPADDVLNGIAVDTQDGSIYITGKNWPKMYKIKLVKP